MEIRSNKKAAYRILVTDLMNRKSKTITLYEESDFINEPSCPNLERVITVLKEAVKNL